MTVTADVARDRLRQFLDGLRGFVRAEARAQRQQLERVWRQPLAGRLR